MMPQGTLSRTVLDAQARCLPSRLDPCLPDQVTKHDAHRCVCACVHAPAVCQALRIITFSVTQLPGPSFHCRASSPTATRPWPDHWSGHVVVDVKNQMSKSCGDLIFSSHTIFMLTGARRLAGTGDVCGTAQRNLQ